jgi:hypothetical protein
MICIPHQLVGVMKPRNMRLHHVVAHVEKKRYAYRVVVGTPDGKSSLVIYAAQTGG